MQISKKEKIGLIVFAIIILFISSISYYKNKYKDDVQIVNKSNINTEENSIIQVYICGEVKKSGVYKMKKDSRLVDLIQMAGGFTKDADVESVNLAIKLKDEDYIKIPSKNISNLENISNNTNSVVLNKSNSKKININTATKEELKTLPRIGEAIAQRIIDYREKNGRFKSIDDIKKVKGIGEKMFENIKDLITIIGILITYNI